MLNLLKHVVEYESLIEQAPDMVILECVTFKLDFGRWREGQFCYTLNLCELGDDVWLEEINTNGVSIDKVKVTLGVLP